ncbi:putative pinoresinol-lariciresinol reductase 3 [Lipomyces tetrasporus]|uniref:Pinoresinol-lariciresinol reductase 3 n=1 Tax=Lipomyces tetrasporus TaxID=54092 RepID=A0AAD7VRM7_9ASCO|nr:putative pinoresinol-lariciresinol reductase 3 [Lipomyces tetrasporus]KAJ8100207.1 putative pinoresinol-lariciresinol reductase 3 [Lipomyces tetrasporus]
MKVVIIGASGETGRSIVNGLLESAIEFEITAVSRELSINSKSNDELRKLGVQVVAGDLKDPENDLIRLLTRCDVVISSVTAAALPDQILLSDAAKKAGVGRFIPCFFGPVAPPKGVMKLRETKEDVLNHIKKIYLPYTVIDAGWWYQLSAPRLPSGRIDYGLLAPMERLLGDGSVPSALTHVRDIGRYVARIVADPRTLNKMVFAYNELLTQEQIFDKLEKLSGEKLERSYVSEAELKAEVAKFEELVRNGSTDPMIIQRLWAYQYRYSWGIRGDNTPESAKYLGYLLGKELYPDMDFTTFDGYLKELLDGKARKPYA